MNYGVNRRRYLSISPEERKTIEISWQEGDDFVILKANQEFEDDRRPRWVRVAVPWVAWATLHQFVQQAHEDATKGQQP